MVYNINPLHTVLDYTDPLLTFPFFIGLNEYMDHQYNERIQINILNARSHLNNQV